jgi:hypothetical protein
MRRDEPTIKALLAYANSIIDGGATFYFSLPQSSEKAGDYANLQ